MGASRLRRRPPWDGAPQGKQSIVVDSTASDLPGRSPGRTMCGLAESSLATGPALRPVRRRGSSDDRERPCSQAEHVPPRPPAGRAPLRPHARQHQLRLPRTLGPAAPRRLRPAPPLLHTHGRARHGRATATHPKETPHGRHTEAATALLRPGEHDAREVPVPALDHGHEDRPRRRARHPRRRRRGRRARDARRALSGRPHRDGDRERPGRADRQGSRREPRLPHPTSRGSVLLVHQHPEHAAPRR